MASVMPTWTTRRFSAGLTFQWSYTFSKLLTDADSFYTGNQAEDQYKRSLEKSIGQYDQTHSRLIDLDYNRAPIRKGRGSAIFLHIARDGYRPTEGCVALARSGQVAEAEDCFRPA